MGPGFDVFSFLLPALLLGGAFYLALALAQRRTPSPTAGDASAAGSNGSGTVLAALYTVSLAALLAAFVGFGIEAAYPSPTFPEKPYMSEPMMMEGGATGEEPGFVVAQRTFRTKMEAYQ